MEKRVSTALIKFLNAPPEWFQERTDEQGNNIVTQGTLIVLKLLDNFAIKDLWPQGGFGSMEVPSSRQARKVQREIHRDVIDLLHGRRLDEIEGKLNSIAPPKTELRFIANGTENYRDRSFPNWFITNSHEAVTLNGKRYCVAKVVDNDRSLRQLAYWAMRDLLESGEFKRLGLCERAECGQLTFHATKPMKWCSDQCRWMYFNHADARKKSRRKGGDLYAREQVAAERRMRRR